MALTANVLKDKKEYLEAGMDDVLSKPLAVPALTATIKKFWDTQADDEEQDVTTRDDGKQRRCSISRCWSSIELVRP